MRPILTLPLLAVLAPALPAQTPAAPRRDIPDPGVIATGMRVTPAGVQSVFGGRVTGVRFGAAPGELWVAAAGALYRLDWRAGGVLASAALHGTTGVQGVARDSAAHRILVSTAGRLGAAADTSRLPGGRALSEGIAAVHLRAFDEGARGDAVAPTMFTPPLGEYLAGAPAVAARPAADGRRAAVLPLPSDDALAIVDADSGTVRALVPLGVLPVAAVIAPDGRTAWVTVLGGRRPRAGEPAAKQCCDPRAERIRVEASGRAMPGSVVEVDVAAARVTRSIPVGHHPTGIVRDAARGLLYVADGNDDAVSVVHVADGRVGTIAVAPFRERRTGLAPTAVALAPDGRTLYVALGGVNAVAVYDVADPGAARLRGLVPTSWYPTSIDVSADGRRLAVGTLLGVGSGDGGSDGAPGKRGRYVHAVRGAVNVVELAADAALDAWTAAVARNARLTPAGRPAPAAVRTAAVPRAVPERPGDPSLVRHVVYIIRENRTYDQVLGDLGRGASDSSLTIFGRDVTPNAHALAEQFVTLDHFYASGGNSADGHQWATQANETEYPTWPLYTGRSYPSEADDPLAYSAGGFLWERAQAHGQRVAVFGEYAPNESDTVPARRAALLAEWRARRERGDTDPAFFRRALARRYHTRTDVRSLDRALVREYPGWTQEVPDVIKADVLLDHLREWERAGAMPELVMMSLPNDHTFGTSPAWCTPRACVADNDLALGRIVDRLSHSPFWKDMAIFVVEDDAQNGVDHVDGHRTVALAISPYTRRGVVDSTAYVHPSMLRTIELMLGLQPMSIFDLVATDMRAAFIAPGERPDPTPFQAVAPRVSLFETNPGPAAIRGAGAAARRRASLASARMRFDAPDAAPSEALNRILWHDARGWDTPYPGVRHALFFPLARDLADDEREERGGGRR